MRKKMIAYRTTTLEELEREFNALVEQWTADTFFLSSVQKKAMHPAYQRIIGMGAPVLPLIFQDLPTRQTLWFWALNAITGEDVVPDGVYGSAAVLEWLNWARARGYIE